LETIQEEANFDNVQAEKELKEEIHVLMEQEELKWRPWAKQDWLRDGDHNTKFFHACANQHQHRNRIYKIADREGRICATQTTIEQALVDYYQLYPKTLMHAQML
jgi:hypothetical protein